MQMIIAPAWLSADRLLPRGYDRGTPYAAASAIYHPRFRKKTSSRISPADLPSDVQRAREMLRKRGEGAHRRSVPLDTCGADAFEAGGAPRLKSSR
jgi:hypothetical protein